MYTISKTDFTRKENFIDSETSKMNKKTIRDIFVGAFHETFELQYPVSYSKQIDKNCIYLEIKYQNVHLARALAFFGVPPVLVDINKINLEVNIKQSIEITSSQLGKLALFNFLKINPNRYKNLFSNVLSNILSVPIGLVLNMLGFLGTTISNLVKILTEYPLLVFEQLSLKGIAKCEGLFNGQTIAFREKFFAGLGWLSCSLLYRLLYLSHAIVRTVTSPGKSAKAAWMFAHNEKDPAAEGSLLDTLKNLKQKGLKNITREDVKGIIFVTISTAFSVAGYVVLFKFAVPKIAAKLPSVIEKAPKWIKVAYDFVSTHIPKITAKISAFWHSTFGGSALNAQQAAAGIVQTVPSVAIVATKELWSSYQQMGSSLLTTSNASEQNPQGSQDTDNNTNVDSNNITNALTFFNKYDPSQVETMKGNSQQSSPLPSLGNSKTDTDN